MLKPLINKVADGNNLSLAESGNIIDFISEGKALPTEIAALLTALKLKGETPEEITGFALKIREKATKINLDEFYPIVDSCGTGGDKANTFNISTTSAILASSSGLNVAKHSNVGFTSQCGSSNVLEALGIKLVKTPEDVINSLNKHNISFIHAPFFQKALTYVNSVRKEIGIRTIFNYLGPLTNPAKPSGQVLGVSNIKFAPSLIETLNNIGCRRAIVVTGHNPTLDEISICGKTSIYRLKNGNIDFLEIYPEDFGFNSAKIEEIEGRVPEYNAQLIESVLSGQFDTPRLDAVLLNTSALLWVGRMVNSFEEGIKIALELITTGKALKKLQSLKEPV